MIDRTLDALSGCMFLLIATYIMCRAMLNIMHQYRCNPCRGTGKIGKEICPHCDPEMPGWATERNNP